MELRLLVLQALSIWRQDPTFHKISATAPPTRGLSALEQVFTLSIPLCSKIGILFVGQAVIAIDHHRRNTRKADRKKKKKRGEPRAADAIKCNTNAAKHRKSSLP